MKGYLTCSKCSKKKERSEYEDGRVKNGYQVCKKCDLAVKLVACRKCSERKPKSDFSKERVNSKGNRVCLQCDSIPRKLKCKKCGESKPKDKYTEERIKSKGYRICKACELNCAPRLKGLLKCRKCKEYKDRKLFSYKESRKLREKVCLACPQPISSIDIDSSYEHVGENRELDQRVGKYLRTLHLIRPPLMVVPTLNYRPSNRKEL